MKGKRNFRKVITRMPSGRFTWNLFDQMQNRIDGGLAHSYREARKKAKASEISNVHRSVPLDLRYTILKNVGRAGPTLAFRNRKECGV